MGQAILLLFRYTFAITEMEHDRFKAVNQCLREAAQQATAAGAQKSFDGHEAYRQAEWLEGNT